MKGGKRREMEVMRDVKRERGGQCQNKKSLFPSAGKSQPIRIESQKSCQVRGTCRGDMKWE